MNSIKNNNNEEKILLSLPDNVIKTRIRSTIIEVLLEKIETNNLKEIIISENEIKEHKKITDLLKFESNAKKFFAISLDEIIKKGFLKFSTVDLENKLYSINEQIFKDFFEFFKNLFIGDLICFFLFLKKKYFERK